MILIALLFLSGCSLFNIADRLLDTGERAVRIDAKREYIEQEEEDLEEIERLRKELRKEKTKTRRKKWQKWERKKPKEKRKSAPIRPMLKKKRCTQQLGALGFEEVCEYETSGS